MAENKEEFLTLSGFQVNIDGLDSATYESVQGYGIDVEDISYTDSTNMILNRPGRVSSRDIVLQRRFKQDAELHDWIKNIKEGKKDRKSGSIILMDDEGNEVVRYNFFDAWPKHWSGPVLSKATGGNDILIETMVLSVGDIELS